MNERIKQLTGQVLDELVPDTWTTLGYDKIKEIQFRTAELIVRECVHIAYNKMAVQKRDGIQPSAVCDAIREHFGVEE